MTGKFKLTSLPLGATPFLLKRRQIPDAVQVSLRATVFLLPDDIGVETEPMQIRDELALALNAHVAEDLRSWLVEDICACAQWLVDVSGCTRVSVRLEKMDDRMCPKFHVDSVPLRLLCTYHGAGTEWTDPNTAYSINFEEPYDETLVHHFPAGSIVIYGGSKSASGLRPLWHRSPTVVQGDSRLLLCIDPR